MEGRTHHHVAIQSQQERSSIKVSEQLERYQEWKLLDAHLVGRYVVSENFTTTSRHFPNWQYADVSETPLSWTPFTTASSSEGVALTNAVIRPISEIDLRSLGLEIKARFTLIGDSAVWITTRTKDPREVDAVVCKISKDAESQRIFVTLGSNLDIANEFMFFRKQEIPETVKQRHSANDSTDIKLTFRDNGDAHLSVTVSVNEDPEREVTMSCNKFVPKLSSASAFICATGHRVVLKFASLKYTERLSSSQVKATHHEECCCLI